MTDRELWERYRHSPSAAALGELVRRHVDWVYSAARRQVGDAHQAEDVTQAVFLLLVQKAPRLRANTVLPAWLLKVTRYAAATGRRTEARRKKHETQAAAMKSETSEPIGEEQWEQLAPMLDELVGKLREKDRQAVLLRFYRGMDFAAVGSELGISEEAAKKRVGRAVEKLRQMAQGKGLVLAGAALAEGMLTHTTQAAPAQLAAVVVNVITAPAAAGAAVTIAKGVGQMMTWIKIKLVAGVAIALVIFGATAAVVSQQRQDRSLATQATTQSAATRPATQQADPAKAALLKKLQELRAGTLLVIPQGRGTAIIEDKREPNGASLPSLAPHEVEFVFSGNDALVKGGVQSDDFNATAVLVSGDRRIIYMDGSAGFPSFSAPVRIDRTGGYIFAVHLHAWSFEEIAGLPAMAKVLLMPPLEKDERSAFARFAEAPGTSVSQEGTIVRLISTDNAFVGQTRFRLLLEFDMQFGGMITHYHFEGERKESDGVRTEQMLDWKLEWANEPGQITPVHRLAIGEFKRDGQVTVRQQSEITFKTFVVEDVDPAELTLGNMGIPDGARVVDGVLETEWVYHPTKKGN